MTKKDRVLILDGYNGFIRNYVVDPSLGKDGSPIGGCKGFLKSLQKLSREINPQKIVIVWDGAGGSKRKKKMFAEYKDGRKPIKLNRNINQGFTPSEEAENKNWQFLKLIDYLNEMPIIQLMADDVEADDIIARVCNLKSLQGKMKVIVSSDKDFYQLCNDETIIVRPVQEEIMNVNRVTEKFGIHPNNFALARAIAGDKSDNLDGVGGAGLKTVQKRLPFLVEEKSYMLSEIFAFCEAQTESKIKLFSDILANKDKVELNYKMMQLYVPNISPQTAKKVKDTFDNFVPEFNHTTIIKKMIMDGITDYNWETLFGFFRSMAAESKTFKTN